MAGKARKTTSLALSFYQKYRFLDWLIAINFASAAQLRQAILIELDFLFVFLSQDDTSSHNFALGYLNDPLHQSFSLFRVYLTFKACQNDLI